MSLSYLLNSGKNSKLPYFAKNIIRMALPDALCRRKLEKVLSQVDRRPDKYYIMDRVNYYNKLTEAVALPETSPRIGDLSLKNGRSAYFFDSREFTRWFDPELKWNYLFGDITKVPPFPAILKSRPIHGDNANSVLLNLDKNRHFTFLKDRIPFTSKDNKAVFRGHLGNKQNRIDFMRKFHGSDFCDAYAIPDGKEHPEGWVGEKIPLWAHLKYKFILALEGNDVASNLKWIMSSDSLAVTPRMRYETWYMEGRLLPGVHYVEIADDYSDLQQKMLYYIDRPAEAAEISRNAHEYIAQFMDADREKLVSLLVLDKYFRMTGQR